MESKICVITGATSGIGNAVAHQLAQQNHTVILVGRNPDKGKSALKEIVSKTGNSQVHYFNADLSSQREIREVGEAIRKQFPVIDVLLNNAAQWNSRYEVTEDGIEKQFAINHLAYFLLTHLLYPSVSRSKNGRIINIGSDSHRYGKINFENLNLKNEYHGLKAYGQSKLANLLFSYELHRQKKETHVSVYCVQPGLVKTDIGVKHTNPFHSLMWKLRRLSGITTEKAAASIVYLAISDDVAEKSGLYWDNKKSKPSSERSHNTADARRLWEMSKALCSINEFFEVEPVQQHLRR